MHKESLRFRTYLFFFVLLLLSGVKLFGALYMENQSKIYYGWVIHTHEAKELSNELLSQLIDAETGQRGYLLTRDQSYLEPYLSGIREAKISWQALNKKTSDNPVQQERLDDLYSLIDVKFAELKQTIDLLNSGRAEESLNLVKTDQGKVLMDDIRRELELFIEEENRLLSIRGESFLKFQSTMERFFMMEALAFAIILIVLSVAVIKKVISPILQLNESMRRFKVEQSFEPVIIDNQDEIGELAKSFNSMAEQAMISARTLAEKANTAEKETTRRSARTRIRSRGFSIAVIWKRSWCKRSRQSARRSRDECTDAGY